MYIICLLCPTLHSTSSNSRQIYLSKQSHTVYFVPLNTNTSTIEKQCLTLRHPANCIYRTIMISMTDMFEVAGQRNSPLTSSPYAGVSEAHTALHFETHMPGQHKSPQFSPESALLHNQHIDYNPAPLNHWVLDVAQYDSPLSGSPSVSGSETFSSPPEYPEVQPVYHLLGQPLTLGSDNMIDNQSWPAGFDEVWRHQNDFQLSQMPLWTRRDEPSVPHPSHYLPLYPARLQPQERESRAEMLSQTLPHPTTLTSFSTHTAHDINSASTFDSDCDSESDSSDSGDEDAYAFSDYSQRPQHRSGHHAKHKDAAVLKLGKWSMSSDALHISEQRHFQCQYSKYPDAHGRWCTKSFVRPEHLRRHHKTVHGSERNYVCKVPGCKRHFSRGDNLRDHYWTHVHRGGRAGKNTKMTLAELKDILGPKEKRLIRRLKQRLSKTKSGNFKIKSRL